MTHMVKCVKLGKEAPGLPVPPVPGELGQKIYDNVSMEAWQEWLKQQTILINEYRLSVIDPEAQSFLQKEMERFFFGSGSAIPEQFSPQQD
jgi:Fe-S cluster biosynthesis and repair protein YggX